MKAKKKILVILFLLLGLMVCQAGVSKAEPMGTAFTYQGRLLDANDSARGVYDMMFHLYDSPEGPNEIGVTDLQDVEIPDGYFTVVLDFGSEVFSGDWRWLEISIRPGDSNDPDAYVTVNPRQQITPAPYALYARQAGVEIPFVLTADISGNAVIVGINEGDGYGLGGLSATGHGVRGQSTSGYGVLGTNTGGNYGYLGGSDCGVYGEAPGDQPGVKGRSQNGDGVVGWTGASNKSGVYGWSTIGAGVTGRCEGSGNTGFLGGSTCGAYGYDSSGNFGLLGSSNYGVYGNSNYGYGVYGFSENTYGVVGDCNDGYGVYGKNRSTENYGYIGSDKYGVYGKNESSGNYGYIGSNQYGVYGENVSSGSSGYIGGYLDGGLFGSAVTDGRGVHGWAIGSSGIGVKGYASNAGDTTNYGGHFTANGKSGRGVYAEASGSSGIGVEGYGKAYDFYAIGPGVDYGTSSSIRWKRDIQPIGNPLEKVMQLRGVYFNWDAEHGGEHDVGMIAEEVGQVMPEIVSYEENGIDATGMDYSKLTPLLVEAIKELKAENDALKQRLEKLEKTLQQSQLTFVKEVQQ